MPQSLFSNTVPFHHNSVLGPRLQVGQRRPIFCKPSFSLLFVRFLGMLAHRQSSAQSVGVHGLNAVVRLFAPLCYQRTTPFVSLGIPNQLRL